MPPRKRLHGLKGKQPKKQPKKLQNMSSLQLQTIGKKDRVLAKSLYASGSSQQDIIHIIKKNRAIQRFGTRAVFIGKVGY